MRRGRRVVEWHRDVERFGHEGDGAQPVAGPVLGNPLRIRQHDVVVGGEACEVGPVEVTDPQRRRVTDVHRRTVHARVAAADPDGVGDAVFATVRERTSYDPCKRLQQPIPGVEDEASGMATLKDVARTAGVSVASVSGSSYLRLVWATRRVRLVG